MRSLSVIGDYRRVIVNREYYRQFTLRRGNYGDFRNNYAFCECDKAAGYYVVIHYKTTSGATFDKRK